MSERAVGRDGQPIREAGPIRVSTAPDVGTRWDAIAFTLLVALALVTAAATAPRWSRDLIARSERGVAAPSVTAPPVTTPAPTVPPVAGLSSSWVAQSGYPVIATGGTATITVTFRNMGTAEWRRGTPSEVRLGIIGDPGYEPAMAAKWPYPERPAIQSEPVVQPGELATFTFDVRGARPGTFRLRLRPVVDGVAWLEDEGVYVDVDVR